MHRQSLGSPVSKLHSDGAGGANLTIDDQKRKDQVSSLTDDDKPNNELQKPLKSPWKPERFVHLIPLLTILCFLILILSSHDPSRKELAQFNGFKRSSKPIDSTETEDFGRVLEIENGDVLAIRSLRNLQDIRIHSQKYRLHRKTGDF
ncbi:hypothetical protein F0562_007704 [Nyssa sinensis]|uniref:Uncharacterized protein n=1 Tax=Nyssa sinensis TaxID=561372 RepID=A0A5J5A6F4_9ASTE|nr:hypothetical protein F0562_007704 [Nyssa sinensis]